MKKQNNKPGTSKLPKGAYRLPDGNYVTVGNWSEPDHCGRRIRITAVHTDPPNIEKLARAFLMIAEEMNEREKKGRSRPS